MDGRFDDDKQFIFQAGMPTAVANIPVNSAINNALLSIRLSPSVDSGLTGLLGARDLINRMQLTMAQTDVAVTCGATNSVFLIKLILNAKLNTATGNNWVPVGGSSLAQVMYHPTGTITTVTGGETIFSFFVTIPSSSTGYLTQELNKVRDLGTSITGGGNLSTGFTTASNVYPDGPDVITITASLISGNATNTVNSRIAWTEAQA